MFVRYPSHAYELEDDETGECIARGIVVEYSDSECFIDSVAVTPEYQGQGYGSQILQLILREYRTVKLYLAVESYGTERLGTLSMGLSGMRLRSTWLDYRQPHNDCYLYT